jgi:hypothetical protein
MWLAGALAVESRLWLGGVVSIRREQPYDQEGNCPYLFPPVCFLLVCPLVCVLLP